MGKKKSVVHQFIPSSDISTYCVIVFSFKWYHKSCLLWHRMGLVLVNITVYHTVFSYNENHPLPTFSEISLSRYSYKQRDVQKIIKNQESFEYDASLPTVPMFPYKYWYQCLSVPIRLEQKYNP